jgi:hypothetical protein
MKRAAALAILWLPLASSAAAWDTSVDRAADGFRLFHELKVGALAHDVPYMWSGFNKEPYNVDLNLEVQFAPIARFWGGALHPVVGATINFEGYTSKAYASFRWYYEFSNKTYFGLGLGIAVHDGETFTADPDRKQLGRRWLFHDSFEWGYRFDQHNSISIYYEHISNASTAAKNQGLDTIGLRYGYRF